MKQYTLAISTTIAIAIAWLFWAVPSAQSAQAPIRLAIAAIVVALLPGYNLMRAGGWFADAAPFRERWPLAFGIGFSLMTVLQVAAIVLHLSAAQALALLSIATLGLAFAPSRWPESVTPSTSPRGSALAALVAFVIIVSCGWMIEPRITGEETVELISIRKIAENPAITLDGIMPEPAAVPTYVITPYYMFVALVSKASGLSMFVAYLKLRALYAGLALLTVSALAARAFPRFGGVMGDAVLIGLVALFAADPDPWTWPASLFPLVRRGGVGAGVVAPLMMLALLMHATHRSIRERAQWIVGGLMLLALLTTHAMEIIYVGFFGVALVISAVITRGSWVSFARLASFAAAAAAVAVVYRSIHSRLAAHVYAFDRASQEQAVIRLKAEFASGWASLSGISEAGHYLISTSGAVVPYTVLGILIAPLLIRIDRGGGLLIWIAATVPLIVYSSSKLFVLLQLATSSEVLFVFGYFTLFGAIALLAVITVGVDRLAGAPGVRRVLDRHAAMPFAVAACAGVAGYVATFALKPITTVIVTRPLSLVWIAILAGIAAAVLGRRDASLEPRRPPASGLIAAAVVAALAVGMRGFPGQIVSLREPLPQSLARAWHQPSVLDWQAFYPRLQEQSNPPIDLPAQVVTDLEDRLPPLQTLIADPAHSFSLPVVLNQHIVNPGHVISTSLAYFERYAPLDDKGVRHHPIFNDSSVMTEDERRFLEDYAVQYVLVDPPYHDRVVAKLEGDTPQRFERIYERDGFVLYRRRDGHGR